jgi:hypothetical protein
MLRGYVVVVVMTYGVSLWLGLAHIDGQHHPGEPALVAHWLRDATLALPAVTVAVYLGLLLAKRLTGAHELLRTARLAVTAAVVAGLTALSFGIGAVVHAWLFPAEHQTIGWLAHATLDGLLALAAALPLAAALVAAGARDRSARPPDAPRPASAFDLGAALQGAGAPAAMVLEAGTTRRRFVQYGAAGAAVLGSTGALRAYAATSGDDTLSDKVDPCFDKSPRGRPFTRELVIPPVLEPIARTEQADVYEIAELSATTEIVAGIRTPVWGYNGITPGPTIMARKGRRVEVTFTNRLPADGDPGGLIVKTPIDPRRIRSSSPAPSSTCTASTAIRSPTAMPPTCACRVTACAISTPTTRTSDPPPCGTTTTRCTSPRTTSSAAWRACTS